MMDEDALAATIGRLQPDRVGGTVAAVGDQSFQARGLAALARLGDRAELEMRCGGRLAGEIVGLSGGEATVMAFGAVSGAALGDRVWLSPETAPAPSDAWLGQVIGPEGRPLDGLSRGGALGPEGPARPLRAQPPSAMARRGLGPRLSTGHAALDTMLPLRRGQRVGVFAGSGVGKSRLKAALAQRMEADVVVIGLIGERGREVREFVDDVLGEEAMARSVVIAATSDQPAALKRRAAWLTLATAEHFRDQGAHVLLLLDSMTRIAEAHREVALTGGESASLFGFPPSTGPMIASLAERAGPGPRKGSGGRWGAAPGDITAVFTVLVAGSDMEEPVADMVRGILDGHIILSRDIAERGRFPAIDVRRSVSRALPEAASADENVLIGKARRLLAAYEEAEPMIQIGLYKPGADPQLDEAVRVWPALDAFFAEASEAPEAAFQRLAAILGPGEGSGAEPDVAAPAAARDGASAEEVAPDAGA